LTSTANQPDVALDVYGTLVDPIGMKPHLERLLGGSAEAFATLWREKQLEYSFRRALMRAYQSFSTCTREALTYCCQTFEVRLSPEAEQELIAQYRRLPAYPDAKAGLERLRLKARKLVAFSNGEEHTVRDLLANALLTDSFEAVVSVEAIRSFKPDPEVYRFLANRLERNPSAIWMVSSNPFDVIGAKHAGLQAAWIRRSARAVFDPWGIEPDLTAHSLLDFAEQLER
jgi:2-haloacid dehalogenase